MPVIIWKLWDDITKAGDIPAFVILDFNGNYSAGPSPFSFSDSFSAFVSFSFGSS